MSIFYLNHNILEAQQTFLDLRSRLIEIVEINQHLSKNNHEMFVYSNLWNITVLGDTLKTYMYKIPNKDEVSLLVLSLVNSGPFYYENSNASKLIISPSVSVNNFVTKLLGVCFKDKQPLVLSANNEPDLTQEKYELKKENVFHIVQNYIGLEKIKEYLDTNVNPTNIFEVIEIINQYYKNIIMMDSSIKSSKQHNFQGKFKDVLNLIKALEDVELPLLHEGVNDEERRKIFYESTGFEISKESEKTLKVRKYRSEREFVIAGYGTILFEWHIKIGLNTRIHYYIDRDSNKIYVGHCGRHLGTVSYNS